MKINSKMKQIPTNEEEDEFLQESNAIEDEHSVEAFRDAKQAWTMACVCFKDGLIIDYICGIHRRLMKRLNPQIAGKLRKCRVWVGYREGLEWTEIPKELAILCKDWEDNKSILKDYSDLDKEKYIKAWHVTFEKIHPFVDGNGRTGRILMNVQRLALGLPLLIIHTGKEQQTYYGWFKEKK
jgi:fido (protein-threonine AMPylation protein)